jgi:uncharacterized protein YndB with AHSA1/START domain
MVTEQRPETVVDESVVIAAPAHRVWQGVVVAETRAGWWEYLRLDATVGGRFEERWRDGDGQEMITSGVVTDLIGDQLLVLQWADEHWPTTTRVEIRLEETGSATKVRVQHTGWDQLPAGVTLAEEHRAGWRLHLDNLRRCVESAVETQGP